MVKAKRRRIRDERGRGLPPAAPGAALLARPGAKRFARLALALVALVAVGGIAAWGSSWLLGRVPAVPDRSELPLLATIPALPDPTGAPPRLTQALTEADRGLRQAARAGAPPETIGGLAGRLGDLYQANTFGLRAAACYRLASDLDPGNPRWPYLLAHLGQERGEVETVTPLLQRTVELDSTYAPAWLRLADNQFKQGRFDTARLAYETRLGLVAGDPWARLGLARLEIESANWDRAEARLAEAIGGAPEFGSAHRLLAAVHAHFGRSGAAAAARRQADGLDRYHAAPDPWVDGLLAQSFDVEWLLFNVSRYAYIDPELTRRLFERARSLAPRSAEVYVVLGAHVGTIEEARGAFEMAVSLDPEHGTAHARLGEALYRLGEPDRALDLLRRAVDLGVTTANVFRFLGLALEAAGRFDAAVAALEQAVARAPEGVNERYTLASVLRAAGRPEDAARELRRVLVLRPDHAQAEQDLAALGVR